MLADADAPSTTFSNPSQFVNVKLAVTGYMLAKFTTLLPLGI